MINYLINTHVTFCNFPKPWQIMFQKPATTMMEGIIDLHHDIMAFLVIILIFVSFMMLTIIMRYAQKPGFSLAFMKFHKGHGITHDTFLETVWTIIPTIILLIIATPSFALVYALDEIVEPQLTVRIAGRQWYWTYEFPDALVIRRTLVQETFQSVGEMKHYQDLLSSYFDKQISKQTIMSVSAAVETIDRYQLYYDTHQAWRRAQVTPELDFVDVATRADFQTPLSILVKTEYPGFSFDSYLIPTEDLLPGAFRLLEVDRCLVLPNNTNIRLLVTAYDVLHSWAVPAFGVKIDAVPGRLNEYFLNVKYNGLFYGQCSEICGVNHAFMPIKVHITDIETFSQWFAVNSVLEAPTYKFLNFLTVETSFNDFWNLYQLGVIDKNALKQVFLDFCLKNPDEVLLEKRFSDLLKQNLTPFDFDGLVLDAGIFSETDLSRWIFDALHRKSLVSDITFFDLFLDSASFDDFMSFLETLSDDEREIFVKEFDEMSEWIHDLLNNPRTR